MPSGGDAASRTRAAISNGTIEVRGNKNQNLASLSRDTDNAHQALGKIFDLEKIQRQQEVAQAFGEVANQAVGDLSSKLKDYYQNRKAEAEYNLSRAKANGDEAAIKKATADFESSKSMEKIWSDGGMAKIALHTIVGGVQAGIGGGNIGAGALAGLTSEAAVPYLSDALKAMKVEEGSELYKSLMKVGAAAVGAGAGAVTGGGATGVGSGASTALANIENNYLKHQEILDKNKRLAACKSKEECNKIEAEYKQLSETRDNKLATCVGDNSETCQGLRQEVRYAYAEIIRYGSKNIIYGLDSEKTKIQADRTLSMSDRLQGTGAGYVNSFVDGLVGLGKGLGTAAAALAGYEDAQKETGDFFKQLANNPGRVLEAILNQTPEQREKLAQAYERGDAYEIGKVGGEILSNTPIGGGVGTIGKIGKAGKIADEIGDIAKAAKAAEKDAAQLVEGLAYRKDLPSHLVNDGFTNGKLFGTHNQEEAISVLQKEGINYRVEPTATPGISELKYEIPNAQGNIIEKTKTVYDPNVFSDQKMLEMAQEAGKQGYQKFLNNGAVNPKVTVDGVNFRVYMNQDPTTGAWYVGNAFPIK